MSDAQKTPPASPAAASSRSFFEDRFDLDERGLEAALGTALERQVDHADLYFEYTTQDSVSLEEGIVKSGSRHVNQGVGVRAVRGECQGYAHSDEISIDSIQLAATTARAISDQSGPGSAVAIGAGGAGHDLYPVATAPTNVAVDRKVALLGEIDSYARRQDPAVKQVMASVITQHRHILVAASDGTIAGDVQPLVRLNVQVIAADGDKREIGFEGMGGRYDLERLMVPETWKRMVDEAIRVAKLNLESVPCPAGTLDVVLGPGWPGILLHEAIGHGLEGDFNRKKHLRLSRSRMGERVASSEGVTVDR